MLVRNTAPVSIFNPTSSVCVTSIQYVICASCTVRQVIHATQSTSWYDLTQYETNHSHLNAALSEFVLLKLPRLLILQQVPTWPQEQKLFISLGPTVGWIWMPGWESSKLNGFFFDPSEVPYFELSFCFPLLLTTLVWPLGNTLDSTKEGNPPQRQFLLCCLLTNECLNVCVD